MLFNAKKQELLTDEMFLLITVYGVFRLILKVGPTKFSSLLILISLPLWEMVRRSTNFWLASDGSYGTQQIIVIHY